MNAIDRPQFASLLVEAHVKLRLRRELRFVPEEIADWGSRDFLAVTNRSFSEGVLIAPLEKTYVVAFQLQKRVPNKTGRAEAIICDFCATWQRGSNSAMISFIRNNTASVSFLCCGDLACSLHVRSRMPQARLSRTQLREDNSETERIARLQRKLKVLLEDI